MKVPQPFVDCHVDPSIPRVRANGNLKRVTISVAVSIRYANNGGKGLADRAVVCVFQLERPRIRDVDSLGSAAISGVPSPADQIQRLAGTRHNGRRLENNCPTGKHLMWPVWVAEPRNRDHLWFTHVADAVSVTIDLIRVGD